MTFGLLDYNFSHFVNQVETSVFYIVPKGKSLIENIGKFHNFEPAKQFASDHKEEWKCDFEVIEVRTVWTTQTLDEAHMLSPDIPHIGRD